MVVAAGARLALLGANPYPSQLSGLSAPNGNIAHNLVSNGRWLVVNVAAEDELVTEDGSIVDPADADLAAADADPSYIHYSIQLPGPALVLAALWKVTGDQRYIYLQVLQALIDATLALLVYWIGLQLFGRRRTALIAAALYALWLPMAAQMVIPFYDSWAAFIPVTALAALLKARASPRPWPWLVALGLVVGAGLYFRFALVLLPVGFGIALMRREGLRKALFFTAVPLGVSLAVLAPLTIRNYVVFDRFIPANTGFGQVLWQGLGDRPNDFGAVNDDVLTYRDVVLPERPDLRYGTPEYDDFLRAKAVAAIREHPSHYLQLIGARILGSTVFVHAKEPSEYADLMASYEDKPSVVAAGAKAGLVAVAVADYAQPLIFVVALIGIVALWRRYPQEMALLVGTTLAVQVVPILLGVRWRYVAPGFFPYFVAAALAIDVWLESRKAEPG